MSAYTYQELDFVFRTQQLLKQYRLIEENNPFSKNYNITLFLNCFVGLLIIPQQYSDREGLINCLSNKTLTQGITKFGINEKDIFVIKKKDYKNKGKYLDEIKNFKNIARHLRNSIAHYHFKIHSTYDKIDRIEFKDYDGKGKNKVLTFDLTISLKNLYIYSLMVSSRFLNVMAYDTENRYNTFRKFKNQDVKHKQMYQEIHDIYIH